MKSLAIGLSGVATLGTGITSYYIYQRSSKTETIKSKLSSLRLISSLSSNKSEMDKQWLEEFNLDKDSIKKVISDIHDDSKGGEVLSKWCNDSLSKPSEEPLLTNVRKWCFIGTIEFKLEKGKKWLEDGESGWEDIWNKHTDTEKRKKVGLTEAKSDGKKGDDISAIKDFVQKTKRKISWQRRRSMFTMKY